MLLRGLFILLAALFIAGGLYFLAASDDEDDEPPSTYMGTYRGSFAAAGSAGRAIVLEVREGGTALMRAEAQGNEPAMVQEGTWVTDADALVVSFRSLNGAPLPRPMTVSFVREDGSIRSVGSPEGLGGQAVRLTKE